MALKRVVLSDLHLGTGARRGELNPMEDFFHDDRFAELVEHYDRSLGPVDELEVILNGDIFDLLKVKVDGRWPTDIDGEVAAKKLQQCLDGHPVFVRALQTLLSKPRRRVTYLPGNHDLDMWFPEPQALFRQHVAPAKAPHRVRFITASDTYYLPEGIQIRHGHQLERIHRVDYNDMTQKGRDGKEYLILPWGSLWILHVMNPFKEERGYIDKVQPLSLFILGALLFDTGFAMRFVLRTAWYFLKWRVFTLRAWRERIRRLPRLLKDEIFSLGDFDQVAMRTLARLRGVHTLIVGHSHGPRYRSLGARKLLVNTGTWMKMINLDVQYLGQDSGLTYALIEYDEKGRPQTSLMRWVGKTPLSEQIPFAD